MDSPFSHLFGANQAPPATEIPAIHELLSKPLEKINQLNSEISRLESALAGLKEERDDVQKYVDAHRQLLSSFLRLPPEILSKIFMHTLPEDRNPICSVSEAPLLLMSICRNWRDVCLSTPHLWSSIHVVLPGCGDANLMCANINAKKRAVGAWLDRSGTLPLSFSICGHCEVSVSMGRAPAGTENQILEQNVEMFSRHLDQFLQCFTRQTRRWQNVELRFTSVCARIFEQSMNHTALVDPDWQTPLLESFTFDLMNGLPARKLVSTCISRLLTAPRLQYLSVSAYIQNILQYLGESNPNLLLLKRLGGMVARGLQPRDVHSLLSRFTNLHTLHLDVCCPQDGFNPYPVISFPQLRNLSLNVDVTEGLSFLDVAVLFNKIRVSTLYSLTVTTGDMFEYIIFDRAPITSILAENPGVRELNLYLPLSIEAYLECLKLVPNLTRLAIHDSFLEKDTAKTLAEHLIPCSERPEPFCSNLRQLVILGLQVDDEMILNLVRSRSNANGHAGVASLDLFWARVQRYRQLEDIEDRLDELRKQGMDINFVYAPEKSRTWLTKVRTDMVFSLDAPLYRQSAIQW